MYKSQIYFPSLSSSSAILDSDRLAFLTKVRFDPVQIRFALAITTLPEPPLSKIYKYVKNRMEV